MPSIKETEEATLELCIDFSTFYLKQCLRDIPQQEASFPTNPASQRCDSRRSGSLKKKRTEREREIAIWQLYSREWRCIACACVSACLWNSPGKNVGIGSYSLFQGIFSTQGLNLGLPHCRQNLDCLSHQRSLVSEDGQMCPRVIRCDCYRNRKTEPNQDSVGVC